jgi:hypothetical protein
MTSINLANLAKAGQLKAEPASQSEFNGLLRSGRARLIDARNASLAIESRFDLGYNASHALALAALRWHGYRSENRYLVFQALEHTTELGPEVWRVFAAAHQKRNLAEYEGYVDIEERLVIDLIEATKVLLAKVEAMGPVTTYSADNH